MGINLDNVKRIAMNLPEKVVNGAWGIVGTLAALTVSTAIDNKRAIAVLDSKVVEVVELNDKMDAISTELSSIGSRLTMVRGDISDLQSEQRKLWIASEKADHRARCDTVNTDLVKRETCYLDFRPSGLE